MLKIEGDALLLLAEPATGVEMELNVDASRFKKSLLEVLAKADNPSLQEEEQRNCDTDSLIKLP